MIRNHAFQVGYFSLHSFEFSPNVFTGFSDKIFLMKRIIQTKKTQVTEEGLLIDPISCFSDLSDSLNSVNSLNFRFV